MLWRTGFHGLGSINCCVPLEVNNSSGSNWRKIMYHTLVLSFFAILWRIKTTMLWRTDFHGLGSINCCVPLEVNSSSGSNWRKNNVPYAYFLIFYNPLEDFCLNPLEYFWGSRLATCEHVRIRWCCVRNHDNTFPPPDSWRKTQQNEKAQRTSERNKSNLNKTRQKHSALLWYCG